MKRKRSDTETCSVCQENKMKENIKGIMLATKSAKKLFRACQECRDDLDLTYECMAVSVDCLMAKFPKRYKWQGAGKTSQSGSGENRPF